MPTLADLKRQCSAIGLTVTPSPARAPYIEALRTYYLKRDYPSGLPYQELCPMLCFSYGDLHPREQANAWKSKNDWIAQEKFNGCRLILHFVKGVGVFCHSRTIDQRTYRRHELTDRLLFRSVIPTFSATLDTEAMVEKLVDTRNFTSGGAVTRSSLQATTAVLHLAAEASLRLQREQEAPLVFYVLDVVAWQGKDLKRRKLCERLGYLADVRTALDRAEIGSYFKYPDVHFEQKEAFFKSVIDRGGEGIVLKHLNCTYEDSTSRSRRGWIKHKRSLELVTYVSGFDPASVKSRWSHMIGCLHLSVVTENGPRLVAKCSNIPYQLRKESSSYDVSTGKVTMNPQLYGKVVMVTGQEFSARAFRLVHPSIVYWRSDLRQIDCTYSQDELENLRAGMTGNPHRKVEGKIL
jgi:hypothetical protein